MAFKSSYSMTPKTGVYPGSGVAPGGQQGRSTAVHNGITGTSSSNRSAGASKVRVTKKPAKGPVRPVLRPGPGVTKPKPVVPVGTPVVKPITNDHGPSLNKPKPKVTAPVAPTIQDFNLYKDAQYWTDLNDYRNQLGLIQQADGSLVSQAAQSRLAQLSQQIDPLTMRAVAPGSVGGKTLYDILYDQQTKADARNLALARSDAARKGLVYSGYDMRQRGDLASQSAMATDQLIRNYGTDLVDSRSAAYNAAQQQANAIQQYNQSQAALSAAAAQRGYADALAKFQASIGGY